ncbi:MAG: DUF882 domain-containing protein [Rhizobacter sp.]|nr:DUF882 domain-containing protein [Rhizobacter sp.]
MNHTPPGAGRRRFLRHGARLAAVGGLSAVIVPARAEAAARTLSFAHTHTGERITLAYAQASRFLPDALVRLNHFLRDHYSGDVGHMDPALFDQLYRVQQALGARGAFEVISGYRCPTTNNRLRLTGGGGVAKHSLHMEGRAIDVRLPGVPLAELRDAALSLGAGGVGYYPAQQFVHVDTGRVRRW